MICFVEALAIGLFLQDVFREKNKKTVLCGGALATIIYAAMMVFVYSFKNIKVNNKIAAEVCAFFVVYLLLLVGGTRIRKLYRIFPAAVLLVLVCELFALNYPSLWHLSLIHI